MRVLLLDNLTPKQVLLAQGTRTINWNNVVLLRRAQEIFGEAYYMKWYRTFWTRDAHGRLERRESR